jgi:hypothetical protein
MKVASTVLCATKRATVILEAAQTEGGELKTPVESGAYPNDPEANSAGGGQ